MSDPLCEVCEPKETFPLHETLFLVGVIRMETMEVNGDVICRYTSDDSSVVPVCFFIVKRPCKVETIDTSHLSFSSCHIPSNISGFKLNGIVYPFLNLDPDNVCISRGGRITGSSFPNHNLKTCLYLSKNSFRYRYLDQYSLVESDGFNLSKADSKKISTSSSSLKSRSDCKGSVQSQCVLFL